jgi:cytochrome b
MTTIENARLSPAKPHSETKTYRRVWDWPTRLFHWSLVAALLGAYVSNKLGAGYFSLHLFFGYMVIVLVAFRIIWGFVGSHHARFANFVKGPQGVLHYLSAVGSGRHARYVGHNPLGALMVLALLALLGAQAAFGLFGDDEIFNVGPLAASVSKETSLLFTSFHRKLFYIILAAVCVHVAAVFAHGVVRREPIIRAMVTGKKPSEFVPHEESLKSSRGAIAFLLFVVIVAALALGLHFAPSPHADLAAF